MSGQDQSRRSPKRSWWSHLRFYYVPPPINDLKEELHRLDAREPPGEASERDRKRFLEEKELAKAALVEELRRAEYFQGKPWLSHAPLVLWSTAIVTAILIWLLVR